MSKARSWARSVRRQESQPIQIGSPLQPTTAHETTCRTCYAQFTTTRITEHCPACEGARRARRRRRRKSG